MKIRNSKGELYMVCPFLEKIASAVDDYLPLDIKFQVSRHLEAVREISKVWQGKLGIEDYSCSDPSLTGLNIAQPYNFEAVLKRIRIAIQTNTLTEETLNQILEMYL